MKKNKILIPECDIIRHMILPQPLAAEKLGVSISTLKRSYYEMTGHRKRWPVNAPSSSCGDVYEKGDIRYILGREKENCKYLDNMTMTILDVTFGAKH